MSHVTITGWSHHVMVMVTRSCNVEKVIKDSRTDNIIQYNMNQEPSVYKIE